MTALKKTVGTRRGVEPLGRPQAMVPRRREEGRDLVLDRAVRLVVGRQERPDLGIGREAIAQELDGTRLRRRRESRRWRARETVYASRGRRGRERAAIAFYPVAGPAARARRSEAQGA